MHLKPFKLERFFAKYEFTAKHLLCGSDCQSFTVRELLELEPTAQDRFQQHWLGYTESQGSPTLRSEICSIYEAIEPEHVLVHSGAEEAIFLFMHAALKAGDHAIVHWPCYQSLSEVAHAIGCDVSRWVADECHGWRLDLDELRGFIRPTTRIIVVNTPHNPTGYLMGEAEFRELVSIAEEHAVTLFCDEVYRESEYDAGDRLPAACDLSERSVSLGVMSKTYGLPGLRIGWIATRDKEIYARMAALKDYTTICNSAPSEFLAELALRQRKVLVRRNLQIIEHNLNILDDFFGRHTELFEWRRPKAGPIAFPRLLKGDVESFCRNLVAATGVLLLPGTVYDHDGNNFRIGFGRENLADAVVQLGKFL